MREILFRGKDLEDGEWLFGYYTEQNGCVFGAVIENEKWDRRVDPATVGQYTGMKDANGEMIFEGDIIQNRDGYLFSRQYRCEVEYNCGGFWASDGWVEINPGSFCDCEIVGSIYDND